MALVLLGNSAATLREVRLHSFRRPAPELFLALGHCARLQTCHLDLDLYSSAPCQEALCASLRALTSVTNLGMPQLCEKVTDRVLAAAVHLPLKRLTLGSVDATALQRLAIFAQLRALDVRECPKTVDARFLDEVAALPHLASFSTGYSLLRPALGFLWPRPSRPPLSVNLNLHEARLDELLPLATGLCGRALTHYDEGTDIHVASPLVVRDALLAIEAGAWANLRSFTSHFAWPYGSKLVAALAASCPQLTQLTLKVDSVASLQTATDRLLRTLPRLVALAVHCCEPGGRAVWPPTAATTAVLAKAAVSPFVVAELQTLELDLTTAALLETFRFPGLCSLTVHRAPWAELWPALRSWLPPLTTIHCLDCSHQSAPLVVSLP